MMVDLAVIPAAGKGTRMRHATRVVPKAFLPIVDRPAVQYVVEEAVRAGAREVIIVVNPEVIPLVDTYFSAPVPGMEDVVITPVVQPEALGLGNAILSARDASDGRPFFCLLADMIAKVDVLDGMGEFFDGTSIMSLREIEDDLLSKYGVVVPGEWRSENLVEVNGAIEKPGIVRAPSRLGLIGRYLFTSEVFDILENLTPGHGGEVQLTDAIHELGVGGRCLGSVSRGELLDIGNPAGFLEASTLLGLAHDEFGGDYRRFLEGLWDG